MSNPTINSISYDANAGVFSFSATNITTNALVVTDFQLKAASKSFTFKSADKLTNATNTSFTVTLSAADMASVNALLNKNDSGSGIYNLNSLTGWDGVSSNVLTTNVSVTGYPSISSASFDAATGKLTLSGVNLTTKVADYIAKDFSLLGQANTRYTLTGGVVEANPSSNKVVIDLINKDQLAVDGLLNQNGSLAIDKTAYSLSGLIGWDGKTAAPFSGLTIAVSNLSAPTINTVAYNAIKGLLTVTGANLVNLGKNNGINVTDLQLIATNHHYNFTNSDVLSSINSSGTTFTITLSNTDKTSVNSFFTTNTSTGSNNYFLTASNGWDAGGGANSQQAVNVTGANSINLSGFTHSTGLDTRALTIFNSVVVNDTDNLDKDTATISFAAANGLLKGSGLSAATVSKGIVSYTLASTTPAKLQTEIDNLAFWPTQKQTTGGQMTNTVFTLQVKGGDSALAIATDSSTQTTVTSSAPTINAVNYNAGSGVLTVTGSNLTTGVVLADLKLAVANNSFSFNSKTDLLGAVKANSFTINLSNPDKASLNSFFNTNGTSSAGHNYSLSVSNAWDGLASYAVTNQSVTVSGVTTPNTLGLTGFSSNTSINDNTAFQPFASLKLNDSDIYDTDSASVTFTAANGVLTGNGLSAGIISGNTISYRLAASTASNLQAELQSLLFTPTLHQTAGGQSTTSTFTLNINGSDSNLDVLTNASTQVVVTSTAPALTSANYNAATGIMTIAGNHLNNNLAINAFTLSAGEQSFNLNSNDSLRNNDNSFSIRLNQHDQSLVNQLFTNNGSSAYKLIFNNDWDGENTSEIPTLNVNVSGVASVNTISISGFASNLAINDSSTVAPFAEVSINDSNDSDSDSATLSFNAGSGRLAGTGLSAGVVNNGVVSYTLPATTADQLETELNSLVFTTSPHQTVPGSTTSVAFTVNVIGSASTLDNVTDTSTTVSVTASANPVISTASYDANAGKLIINGLNFTNTIKDFNLQALTLIGQNGTHYQLSGGLVENNLSRSQVTINLNKADQFAVAGLFNQNGAYAGDNTRYALQANVGWDNNTVLTSSQTVNVTGVSTPSLTSARYNAVTGSLVFTGSALAKLATNAGLVLSDFTLSAGNSSYALNSATDTITNFTPTGFTVNLANPAMVNALLASNGYNLNVTSGWDAGVGASNNNLALSVIGTTTISLMGLNSQLALVDTSSCLPFANATITDNNNNEIDSASISFPAANGSLAGVGLSAASVVGNTVSYNLAANSPSSLQQSLDNLVFTPTPYQAASGQSITTNFTVTVNGQLLPTLLSTGIALPNSLATDSYGDIFISNSANNTVSEFSATGSLLQTLSNGIASPQALATDSQGNVFVVNKGINKSVNSVKEFSNSGALLHTLSSGISAPDAVITDSKGDVFVANTGSATYGYNTVTEYAPTGNLIRTLNSGITSPVALAIDSKGDLFVANIYADTVIEFNANGSVLHTLSNGLASPMSLATDSAGNVFIANNANSTVSEFNNSGSLVRTLSVGINQPSNVAVDSVGTLYVLNAGNATVSEFSATGSLLSVLSNGIAGASSISIDSKGDLFVANANNTVEEFFANGAITATAINSNNQVTVTASTPLPITVVNYNAATGVFTVIGNSFSSGIAMTNIGISVGNQSFNLSTTDTISNLTANTFNILLGSNDKAAVNALLSANGNAIAGNNYNFYTQANWDSNNSYATSAVINVSGDSGISLTGLTNSVTLLDTATLRPFANLQLNDTFSHDNDSATISFPAANGQLVGNGLSLGVENSNGIISYQLPATSPANLQLALQNLQFAPTSHQVAVGQTDNTTLNLVITGQQASINATPNLIITNNLSSPESIAIDSSGNVYVANTYNNTIAEFSATGANLAIFSTGIDNPRSISIANTGQLYIANHDGSNILLLSANTNNAFNQLVNEPDSLAVNSMGDVFVANQGNNSVTEYSSTGQLLMTLSTGISQPNSLALDSKGDVFVANFNNNTVTEFSASGVLLQTLSTGISYAVSVATDQYGDVFVANAGNNTIQEFSASAALLNTLTNGITSPQALAVDSAGDVFVANTYNNTVTEYAANGDLTQTLTRGIANPDGLAIDSFGNLWVSNAGNDTVVEFSLNNGSLSSVSYSAAQLTVNATANSFTISPNSSISNASILTAVHSGDSLTIPDAKSFVTTAVSSANVNAIAGDVNSLSSWVNAALSSQGADIASHALAWFQFNNTTYLIEQAGNQGSAYAAGDTLVQLVGVFNESNASFNGHSLVI